MHYLYHRYADEVYKFLVYFTRNRDVEDLVQDTFVRAMKGIGKFRGDNARAWLISIARNVALDKFRDLNRLAMIEQKAVDTWKAHEKSPEEWVEFKDDEERILDTLNAMRRGYKEVVICRAFMDMSSEETAKVLGWSRNRVNVTLHRAIKALRSALIEPSGGELGDLAKGR